MTRKREGITTERRAGLRHEIDLDHGREREVEAEVRRNITTDVDIDLPPWLKMRRRPRDEESEDVNVVVVVKKMVMMKTRKREIVMKMWKGMVSRNDQGPLHHLTPSAPATEAVEIGINTETVKEIVIESTSLLPTDIAPAIVRVMMTGLEAGTAIETVIEIGSAAIATAVAALRKSKRDLKNPLPRLPLNQKTHHADHPLYPTSPTASKSKALVPAVKVPWKKSKKSSSPQDPAKTAFQARLLFVTRKEKRKIDIVKRKTLPGIAHPAIVILSVIPLVRRNENTTRKERKRERSHHLLLLWRLFKIRIPLKEKHEIASGCLRRRSAWQA
jgi:hypothetical protein